MSTGGILVSLVVLVFSLAWVFRPLFLRNQAMGIAAKKQRERDELLTLYERVIGAIRDLDEDFRTGKLSQDAYEGERKVWSERGVEVLQALEKVGGKSINGMKFKVDTVTSKQTSPVNDEQELDDAIETAISQYLSSNKENREPARSAR